MMTPFKPFLSPKYKFHWSPAIDGAFEASKLAIIDAIKVVVKIFDITRRTCFRSDWCIAGIGYFLIQKCCTCASQAPHCCPDGWHIILASSRFLSSAESRYDPVEG